MARYVVKSTSNIKGPMAVRDEVAESRKRGVVLIVRRQAK
jgi:hypothetical protein